jgi:hypothetical protein
LRRVGDGHRSPAGLNAAPAATILTFDVAFEASVIAAGVCAGPGTGSRPSTTVVPRVPCALLAKT